MSQNFIIDKTNNKFYSKSYKRIISLVPSITELLFSFGLENYIIGVTKYCIHPPEAQKKTIIGGTKNPNIELIKNLQPDLVLINKEENQKKHYDLLLKEKILVFVVYPQTVDEAFEMIQDLMKLLNISNDQSHQDIINLENIISKIKGNSVSKYEKNKPRVFCPIWKQPWMTINKETFIHSLIEFCGGKNIFAEKKERYPQITMDEIKQSNPNIVLLPDEPYKFETEDKVELEKEFKEVLLIDGTFHWYSFRMIWSLQLLFELFSKEKIT